MTTHGQQTAAEAFLGWSTGAGRSGRQNGSRTAGCHLRRADRAVIPCPGCVGQAGCDGERYLLESRAGDAGAPIRPASAAACPSPGAGSLLRSTLQRRPRQRGPSRLRHATGPTAHQSVHSEPVSNSLPGAVVCRVGDWRRIRVSDAAAQTGPATASPGQPRPADRTCRHSRSPWPPLPA